ncbi:phage tail sheath subtilisin-like domain-containing protein [Exiguobacterium sp.]|uniref:phage tail sheath subtilisin-like domain-containing protein n=1 Tax=Exiguobacterium sp. TaxID=44751 RepID=UPI00289E8585|nr:phage tail sheath subtilisin-like domain-containing protein [Exiguobacterium sp.]
MAYWDKNGPDQVLPGLYMVIEKMQEAAIRPGQRGVIGMVTNGLAASKGKVVTLRNVGEALVALGVSNYKFAKRAFEGGARQIVAYVLEDAEELESGLAKLDPYYFDVFTLGRDLAAGDAEDLKAWRIRNELDGKNYVGVIGGPAGLADNSAIKGAYATGKHGDLMYVGMGGVDLDGVVVSPGELAAWLAGAQGGKGMAQGSLTRKVIGFLSDVERRLTKAEREDLFQAGVAVPVHNGQEVVLDAAITSSKVIEGTNPSKPHHANGKLRIAYNAAVLQTSINEAVESEFIGKINNDLPGQEVLTSALDTFIDTLIDEGVLSPGTAVTVHPDYPSVGDQIFLLIQGYFIDAAERFYIDFQVGNVPVANNTDTAATGGA